MHEREHPTTNQGGTPECIIITSEIENGHPTTNGEGTPAVTFLSFYVLDFSI
jgi:hypothetical protein